MTATGPTAEAEDSGEDEVATEKKAKRVKPWTVIAGLITIASFALAVLTFVGLKPSQPTQPVVVNIGAQPVAPPKQSANCAPYPLLQTSGTGKAVGVRVTAERIDDNQCWAQTVSPIAPGSEVQVSLEYVNSSTSNQDAVIARASLPPHVQLVSNSTKVVNATYPQGARISTDDLQNGGIGIGNYGPGANAFILFKVAIAPSLDLPCGPSEFRLVGVTRPQAMDEYYNTVVMDTYRNC